MIICFAFWAVMFFDLNSNDAEITMPEMENTKTVKFETELPASQEVSMNGEEKLLERLRALGYIE